MNHPNIAELLKTYRDYNRHEVVEFLVRVVTDYDFGFTVK